MKWLAYITHSQSVGGRARIQIHVRTHILYHIQFCFLLSRSVTFLKMALELVPLPSLDISPQPIVVINHFLAELPPWGQSPGAGFPILCSGTTSPLRCSFR